MQDILKNKNAVIGIIVAGVLALGVMLFTVILPSFSGGEEEPAVEEPPVAETPSDAAPTPVGGAMDMATGEVGVAKAGVALPPLESSGSDPFKPLVKPNTPNPRQLLEQQAQREIAALPPLTIYNPRPTAGNDTGTATGQPTDPSLTEGPDTTSRRMAGLVVGKNAYAILEIDGQTAVVKPGDVLPDLSRVERIERDRILLRKGNRPIFVPLSANPAGAAAAGGYTGPTGPSAGSAYRPGGGSAYPGTRGGAPPGYQRR